MISTITVVYTIYNAKQVERGIGLEMRMGGSLWGGTISRGDIFAEPHSLNNTCLLLAVSCTTRTAPQALYTNEPHIILTTTSFDQGYDGSGE